MSVRVCLGVPIFAGHVATLVEAVDSPLQLQAEARALRQIERLYMIPSCKQLLHRLHSSPRTHMGCLVTKLGDLIGPLSSVFPTLPPQDICLLPHMHAEFPGLRKKT